MFVVPSLVIIFSSVFLPAGAHAREHRGRLDIRRALGVTAAADARMHARK